jgi:A/G-specific adenine glycosylase
MRSPRRTFAESLLDWYQENGRHSLPWRADEWTAFEILVAEILLQRTTATAVSGAYAPFVAQYPTPECVVGAPSADIAQRIAPLGLTKRAEYLERCSAELLARHGGDVPRRRNELLALYGVGEYTAHSVLVHAFNEQTTAVDTNVRRLVSRVFDADPDSHRVSEVAEAAVPSGRGSDFLHAMLDFAADVCTARAPACHRCPLEPECQYADSGSRT